MVIADALSFLDGIADCMRMGSIVHVYVCDHDGDVVGELRVIRDVQDVC